MDLETENRIAAILMKEAAELRQQAEKEGVLAYLRQPNARSRPNSRFLTATVLGVQQANRAVEVNEMWRVRHKELELDKRLKGTSRVRSSSDRLHRDGHGSRNTETQPRGVDGSGASASCPSRRAYESFPEGLRDEELEEFLNSRVKRGRGAVGPRMDETGPYLPPLPDGEAMTSPDVRERRVVYGPEKPSSLKLSESSEDELCERRRKKAKKSHSRSSDKEHSKKRKSKSDSKHEKKRRKEKKSEQHHS